MTMGENFHGIDGLKPDLLRVSHFRRTFPLFFASNLLLTSLDSPGLSAAVSEMPKREKACEEFGRDLSDSNTPIYFSSLEFLGPVFADEIYKQTGWTEGGWGQERVVAASQVPQLPEASGLGNLSKLLRFKLQLVQKTHSIELQQC